MKIKRFNELYESNSTNENKIEEFKRYWNENYSFISLELTDAEISDFMTSNNNNVKRATDQAADYLLANGLADVMESNSYTQSDSEKLKGKRIRLIKMKVEKCPLKPGDEGTIDHVDAAGVIHVNWDNGFKLSIIPEIDQYEILD